MFPVPCLGPKVVTVLKVAPLSDERSTTNPVSFVALSLHPRYTFPLREDALKPEGALGAVYVGAFGTITVAILE